MSCGDDGRQIGYQILTGRTPGKVSAGGLRHGHKSLAYEDDFHFLTLHGRSPARRGVELDPATRLRPKLAPRKLPYCSSIVMSRMRFCGMAFLPRLLTDLFLEQVA